MAVRYGSRRAGAFHENHGKRIRLSENKSVARRVDGWFNDDGIVFTAQPIALDTLYRVKLLEKDGQWNGSLVSLIHTAGHLLMTLCTYFPNLTMIYRVLE